MRGKIYKKVYGISRRKKIILWVLGVCFLLFVLMILSALGLFVWYAKDLPRPEKFTERKFVESTKIYDRTGKVLLYEMYGEEKRDIIPLSEMGDYVKEAVISTEDANFYNHHGIDFSGIIRAFKLDLKNMNLAYGGSTISQQLIRSTFLTLDKSVSRKIKEIILTLELERRYSKDQILEWYLNQIPMGVNIYGVQAAARTYFQKDAKDLTLAEAATLAAIIKGPSYYSPFGKNVDALLGRKDYVLDRMAQEHYITQNQADEAKKQELKFAQASSTIKAPHFVLYVQQYLLEKYGETYLQQGGLKVYTTLDWDLQQIAEDAVEKGVERNKANNAHNAAFVAIDPKTGEILSMIGSANWFGEPYPEGCTPGKDCKFDPKLNVATYKIGRQPGSAFKPFAYVTAFSKGYSSEDTVVDEPTNFGNWGGQDYTPQNYDGLFRGEVTLRQALAQSLNIPSVKVLLYLAGLEETLSTARTLGLTTLNNTSSFYGPAIVLGGGEAKLLDMVSAYGVFATEGLKLSPMSVLKIEDSKGGILEENKKTPKRVLSQESCEILNNVLSDNDARAPMFGYNSNLYIPGYQVAAKTGTTNNYKDAWALGYTPSLVAGVWVGNNDNSPMARKPAVTLAGYAWKQFMLQALPKFPKEEFTPPPDRPPTNQNEKSTTEN
jgi:1A family penicillin-binding protein